MDGGFEVPGFEKFERLGEGDTGHFAGGGGPEPDRFLSAADPHPGDAAQVALVSGRRDEGADGKPGAREGFRQPFKAGGEVHRVADDAELSPLLGADLPR